MLPGDVALEDVLGRMGQPVPAAGVRWVEADLLGFEDAPFDAVLFTRSLHHIHPLEEAIERATRLVRPGGLLPERLVARGRLLIVQRRPPVLAPPGPAPRP